MDETTAVVVAVELTFLVELAGLLDVAVLAVDMVILAVVLSQVVAATPLKPVALLELVELLSPLPLLWWSSKSPLNMAVVAVQSLRWRLKLNVVSFSYANVIAS